MTPLAPLAWVRDRRMFLAGTAILLAGIAISIVVAPRAWNDYLALLGSAVAPVGAANVLATVPPVFRLIVALALGVAAVRWVRLAPIAVTLAYPVVWIDALSTLAAIVAPINRFTPAEHLRPGPCSQGR